MSLIEIVVMLAVVPRSQASTENYQFWLQVITLLVAAYLTVDSRRAATVAQKALSDTKTAVDIGNQKTDELAVKTETVHEQFNGRMAAYTAALAAKNKELMDQAIAMTKAERDSVVKELNAQIEALHLNAARTDTHSAAIAIVQAQNQRSIEDRAEIRAHQDQLAAAVQVLTDAAARVMPPAPSPIPVVITSPNPLPVTVLPTPDPDRGAAG
jgi:hypothetical protein